MNKALMESYYAAYNSGDAQALAPFYGEDCLLISAQGEIRGRAALLDTYRWITSQMHDRMTPDTILIDGNRAAVQITDVFTAKQDVADFLGRSLRAGETFSLNLCGIYTLGSSGFERIELYLR